MTKYINKLFSFVRPQSHFSNKKDKNPKYIANLLQFYAPLNIDGPLVQLPKHKNECNFNQDRNKD